jgi:RNA polymerase sigma-70 factor (ECF subfamily)
VQRNNHKKKEKVTVVTDNIKEDDNVEEIEDAQLFELKSEKLAKALSIIDPKDKMILLMKYQDFLTIKEIGEALGIGQSAVKMRIKRAKDKLISVYNENDK